MADQEFRRAMITSQGDMTAFITHPLSATRLGLAVVSRHLWRWINRKNHSKAV